MSLSLGLKSKRAGALAALVALFALAGCSSTSDGDQAESSESAATTAENGAFPVSLDTAYGEIPVPEKPERIVVFSAATSNFSPCSARNPSRGTTVT